MAAAPVRRGLVVLFALLLIVAATAAFAASRRSHAGTPAAAAPAPGSDRIAAVRGADRAAINARVSPALSPHAAGTLPAPVQNAAAVALLGGGALLIGGLTAADTSSADIVRVSTATGGTVTARSIGRLPRALHDAAAVRVGRYAYLLGGGDGVGQHDEILRIDPASGAVTRAGRLPAPSSDQAAAAIGGVAYVVGGYTGARWLDTVVAWRPGGGARIVAHLPFAVRYAAVAAVGSKLVVAGGSLASGAVSDAVLIVDPATGTVQRAGRLPVPTTHAAAASLGGIAFIVGGRGSSKAQRSARITAVTAAGRVSAAGSLRRPLSDPAVVPVGSGLLVAGGATAAGTTSALTVLKLGVHGGALPTRARAPARATSRARAAVSASRNIYAAAGANMLTGAALHALPRIYVPNSSSNTVDVIDPVTHRIVAHFAVGSLPQHVTPAWDLRTLYVLNDKGNSITPIDPRTAKPGTPIPVDDPYNMYFTPDGRFAIVVAERLHRLDFRDPHTFALRHSLHVPCTGIDHMDFSADGRYLIASCEFSGTMLKVDVRRQEVVGTLSLPDGSRGMPQDVKLSPDGKVFYVADMMANGLWKVDGAHLKVIGFLPTGRGVHGLYPSRDATQLYASNRGEGSVSVISFATQRVVAKWHIPGGGSPDMGGVSADGRVLWLSGRYSGVVYALSTTNGRLLAKIRVGSSPHGLSVWPQPGRYSLGHTGILR